MFRVFYEGATSPGFPSYGWLVTGYMDEPDTLVIREFVSREKAEYEQKEFSKLYPHFTYTVVDMSALGDEGC